MVPENTLKYSAGLLLSSFGVFWAYEGLGYFTSAGDSLHWPGGIWALLAILLGWLALSRIAVAALRGKTRTGLV